MKSLFYRILLLTGWLAGAGMTASGQAISNSSFETWAVRTGIEAPTNWLTSDDLYPLRIQGFTRTNTGTVTKSTDAHSSPYAASLKNVAIGNFGYSGSIYLGTRFDAINFLGGIPYASRPAQLQFYYKYTGPATDSADAIVLLTNTLQGETNFLGVGAMLLSPTNGSYVQMTVPISYDPNSSALPDSVRLFFESSIAHRLTIGATLLIDDVALTNSALAVRADASIQNQLTVAPNPSPAGRFQLSAPNEPALASAPYTVLDVTGRVVAKQAALAVPSPTRELDLSNLTAGIYMLRLDTKQGVVVRQLSIK